MNNKYIYLPKEIIKNKSLTPSTKLIYLHLFHLTGWPKEKYIPSNTAISNSLGISRRTVISSMQKLIEAGFLSIEEDRTFRLYINGICFDNKSDLSNKEICNMFGNFVKVPTFSLYLDELTSAERIAYIMMFDFYFDIAEDGFKLKKQNVIISSVATYYGIDKSILQKQIASIRKKGYIDYTTVKSNDKSKNIGFKFFKAEKKWIIYNGKSTKNKEAVITTKEETIQPEEMAEEPIETYIPTEEELNELETLVDNIRPDLNLKWKNLVSKSDDFEYKITWLRKVQKKEIK